MKITFKYFHIRLLGSLLSSNSFTIVFFFVKPMIKSDHLVWQNMMEPFPPIKIIFKSFTLNCLILYFRLIVTFLYIGKLNNNWTIKDSPKWKLFWNTSTLDCLVLYFRLIVSASCFVKPNGKIWYFHQSNYFEIPHIKLLDSLLLPNSCPLILRQNEQ